MDRKRASKIILIKKKLNQVQLVTKG